MSNLEVSFAMIAKVGAAKSSYLEAIKFAKQGDFDKANKLYEEGNVLRIEGHEIHFELVQREANGDANELSLILIHAEDQLANAEMMQILAQEMIDNYVLIYKYIKK